MASIVLMDGYLLTKLQQLRTYFQSLNPFATLYKNNVTPSPSDTIATYTPGDYDGASSLAVLWPNAPFSSGPGEAFMFGQTLIYQPTGITTPNMVYGIYVIDTVNVRLIYAMRFDAAPVAIGGNLDALPVVPTWRERSIV